MFATYYMQIVLSAGNYNELFLRFMKSPELTASEHLSPGSSCHIQLFPLNKNGVFNRKRILLKCNPLCNLSIFYLVVFRL